jgi:hypothetical protein
MVYFNRVGVVVGVGKVVKSSEARSGCNVGAQEVLA